MSYVVLALVVAYAAGVSVIPALAPLSSVLNLPLIGFSTTQIGSINLAPLLSVLPAAIGLGLIEGRKLQPSWIVLSAFGLTSLAVSLIAGSLDVVLLTGLPLWIACKPAQTSDKENDFDDDLDLDEKTSIDFPNPFGLRNRERRKGAKSHRVMIDMLDDGLISVNCEGIITSANAAAEQLIGTACQGMEITRFLTVLRQPEFEDLTAVDRHRLETTIQRESSATLAVEFSLTGRGIGDDWVGVIRLSDNTDRAAQVAKLEQLALHDSLTGLPNRVLFQDRSEQSLAIAGRRQEAMAVMLLDLNKFKQVNDTLGHHVGDLLLQAVGPRLSDPLRQTDTLARIGGDEFAVLLPPSTSKQMAMEVAERLVEMLEEPFVIDGMSLDLGVSIGVAMYPDHGVNIDTLMRSADVAMYEAKKAHLGARLFDAKGEHSMTRRMMLQQELRIAIDNGDIDVVYQPKVSTGNWQVTGFEALVRWQHPQYGVLSPKEFIPLAEQTGLIMPLTLAVVNACLGAQKSWRRNGFDLSVAVNMSPKWLQDREFPKILRLLLENWHGRADRLILEIPESAIMTNPAETTVIMHGLRDQGLELSLDDFCTGYSSLPLLQRLPVQELKIDKRFISEMVKDQNAAIVVGAVIKLAHSLGLRVVAEGVETEEAAEWLRSLGGDELQGYFFGKPMTRDAVPDWIAQSARRQPPTSISQQYDQALSQ